MSPPARGRELKSCPDSHSPKNPGSPPARGRELKYARCAAVLFRAQVAPRAGAGIEIGGIQPAVGQSRPSPPRAGAGIEIAFGSFPASTRASPPARGRELKLACRPVSLSAATSPPTRGRELKYVDIGLCPSQDLSPPVRGRELKLHDGNGGRRHARVAPRAGARIEIR